MEKQYFQVPNKMNASDLEPKDQLIYLSIKKFMNKDTLIAFPSLETIKEVSGASIPTIRECIKRLEDKNYIEVIKDGRKNTYKFNKYKNFEVFSPEFLSNKNISFTTKSYLVASQQYMFKDIEDYGKISMPNTELSNCINMPESTIRKCNKELERKNYLTIIKNESRDLETGCKTDTKLFKLRELGQAVIWTLKDHEDRINQNADDIQMLKEEIKALKEKDLEKDKLIQKLLSDNAIQNQAYTI